MVCRCFRTRHVLYDRRPAQRCQAAAAKGFGQKAAQEAAGQGRAKGRTVKGADAAVNGASQQVSLASRHNFPRMGIYACIASEGL